MKKHSEGDSNHVSLPDPTGPTGLLSREQES